MIRPELKALYQDARDWVVWAKEETGPVADLLTEIEILVGELMRAEFWRLHRESREWDCDACRDQDGDPKHAYEPEDWQLAAKKALEE